MNARRLLAGLAIAALALFATPRAAEAGPCQVRIAGELDVQWDQNRPLVQINVNGHRPYALVDTGATASALFGSALPDLGLRTFDTSSRRYRGFGGGRGTVGLARVPGFSIVGDQTHTESLRVIETTWRGRADVAMTLGEDVLGVSDIEFDFAHGKLRFLQPQGGGCHDAALAYWQGDYSETPFHQDESHQMLAPVEINDREITALIDTGAPVSVVSRDAAQAAGANIETEAPAQTMRGLSGGSEASWLGHFDSFSIGGETIQHTRLRVADWRAERGGRYDMILGADFFRVHRVVTAKSQQKLYFTYLGGPVFQIVGPIELPRNAAAPGAPAKPDTPAPNGQSSQPSSQP